MFAHQQPQSVLQDFSGHWEVLKVSEILANHIFLISNTASVNKSCINYWQMSSYFCFSWLAQCGLLLLVLAVIFFVCFKINRSHWSGLITKCSVSGMDLKRHYPFFFFLVTKLEVRPWSGPVVHCFIQVMSSGSQTPGLVPLPASFNPCSDFWWSAEMPTVTFFHSQTSVCLLFYCLFACGLWVKDLLRPFVI